MSGADLANLVNEAALLATREDKTAVDMADLDAARDKVIMGAKREEVITEKDKRATAYHEVGPRPGRLADRQVRPGPQGHDHPPRPRPGRDPVPSRGRPDQLQREPDQGDARRSNGRPGRRAAGLSTT